jgi:hypothetical protein
MGGDMTPWRARLEVRAAMRAVLYTGVPTALQVRHDPRQVSFVSGAVFLLLAFPVVYVLCLRGLRKQDAREQAWLRHD